MIRLSIHLPAKLRLNINLTKKRKNLDEKPLLPSLGTILRAKKGNKLSKYFRHVFENEKVKKIIGTNLTFLIIASSFLPKQISGTEALEPEKVDSKIIFATETSTQFPLSDIKITQSYRFYHQGIDFDGVTGDEIRPIMAGKVVKTEYSRFGYGKSVLISHGENIQSLYAHLSKIDVTEGQEVTKDTKIGEMGATGRSFGDHLHLEVYENGEAINPLLVLN